MGLLGWVRSNLGWGKSHLSPDLTAKSFIIPQGPLTITRPMSFAPNGIYFPDLGLQLAPGQAQDMGALFTQSEINASLSLKEAIENAAVLMSQVGTIPVAETVTVEGDIQGQVQLLDASSTLINPAREDGNLASLNSKITTTATGVKIDGSAVTQPVSAVSLPLPTGASTEATLSALNTKVATTVNGIKVDGSAATQPISAVVLPLPAGAAQEGGNLATIATNTGNIETHAASLDSKVTTTAGGIKVDGSAVTQPVSAASLPLPSGAATSVNQTNGAQQTQIVQGGNTAIVSVAGAVKVDGSAVTQPVSGTVTAKLDDGAGNAVTSQLSGTQRALDVGINVGGAQVDPRQTRALTSTDTVTVVQSAGANLHVDVDNFPATQPISAVSLPLPTGAATSANQTNGSQQTQIVQGGNAASVTAGNALKVDGSAVTQPVSAAALPLPSGASTEATLSALNTKVTTSVNGVKVDGSAVTQPVSAASLPLPSGAATAANQTNGSQQTQIVQGGNIAAVTTASALKVDGSAVTQPISAAALPLPAGAAQEGGNLATVATNTGAIETHAASLDSKVTTTANGVKVDGSAVTQPVSAASLPLPTGASTSANQTNGSQKSQIVDGSGTVIGPAQTISGSNYLPVTLASSSTPGSAVPARSVMVAGKDGNGNAQSLATDTSGRPQVDLFDGSGNPLSSRLLGSRGLQTVRMDSPQMDSLERARVVQPTVLLGLNFTNTLHPLYFNSALTGSGAVTFNSTMGSAQITTTTSASDSVVLQTKRYLRYVPGYSYQLLLSGVMGPKTTNLRQRFGYFDANNGFFFEITGTDYAVTLRSNTSGSVVDNRVSQSSWNLDKLDGTGPSGYALDTTKHNLYVADYVWQGAGRVRMGVLFGGQIVYCHQFNNSNVNTAPFMRSPSRPGRVELTNLGVTSGTNAVNLVCVVALREGSSVDLAAPYQYTASTQTTQTSVTTSTPLVVVRPLLTFNGLTNRVPLQTFSVSALAGANPLFIQVILNGTLTGGTFSSVDTNSAAQYSVNVTSVTGGTSVASFFVPSGNKSDNIVTQAIQEAVLGLSIDGSTQDNIALVASAIGGGATPTSGSITWEEFQ